MLTISADLPFAQKDGASAGLDNVITLSDHRDLSFGENYGVVMEELRLLARAVFVLDADNKLFIKKLVKVLISQILMLLLSCMQNY